MKYLLFDTRFLPQSVRQQVFVYFSLHVKRSKDPVEGQTSNTLCILSSDNDENVYIHVSEHVYRSHTWTLNNVSTTYELSNKLSTTRSARPQLRSISRSLRNKYFTTVGTHALPFCLSCAVQQSISYILSSTSLKIYSERVHVRLFVPLDVSNVPAFC